MNTDFIDSKKRDRSAAILQNIRFTYSGRGALYQSLVNLADDDRREVLVPGFHCPTVIDPIIHAGKVPIFYSLKDDLTIDVADLQSRLSARTRAVIAIGYFGFPTNIEAIRSVCATRSIAIIEDCAHSFLRSNPVGLTGGRADYSVYSFKKLIPSEIGGGLLARAGEAVTSDTNSAVPIREDIRIIGLYLRQWVESHESNPAILSVLGLRRSIKRLFGSVNNANTSRVTEFSYPFDATLDAADAPGFVRDLILLHDYEKIARVRRDNFLRVLDLIGNQTILVPIFRKLPDAVVPWAFPILINNRSDYDLKMRELGIPVFSFGETLHSTLFAIDDVGSKTVIDQATRLSERLLCIPVHQDLSRSDIDSWRPILSSISSV